MKNLFERKMCSCAIKFEIKISSNNQIAIRKILFNRKGSNLYCGKSTKPQERKLTGGGIKLLS